MKLLGNTVKIYVCYDRDYRADATIEAFAGSLKGSDVRVQHMAQKGLESCLLVPEAIARASGLEVDMAVGLFESAIQELRVDAQASFMSRRRLDAKRGTDFKLVALGASS